MTRVASRSIAFPVVRPARVRPVVVLGLVRVAMVPPCGSSGAFGFATRARRRLGRLDVPEYGDGGLHLRLGSAGLGRRRNHQGSRGVGADRLGANHLGADRLGRARDAGEVGAGAGVVGPRGAGAVSGSSTKRVPRVVGRSRAGARARVGDAETRPGRALAGRRERIGVRQAVEHGLPSGGS